MGYAQTMGKIAAVCILGISPIFSLASGRVSKTSQETAGTSGSGFPATVAGQSRTLLPDGSTLIAGGVDSGTAVRTATISDRQTGAQVQTSGSLIRPRAFHSATLLPNGTVLIFGGVGSDKSVLSNTEIFNPKTQTFTDMQVAGLTPRAHHTATLLTDGRVLFAGGLDSQGHALSQIELWDSRTGKVSTLAIKLNTPRSDHTAKLLPDGTVLLWGGQNENGIPQNDGEIVDPNGPSIRLVGRQSSEAESTAPFLEASVPQSGETGVAINQMISLRFSRPLAMESVSSSTVSLRSSAGTTQTNVVPAEGGILAFVTPQNYLDTETTYTLTISGATDSTGATLPDTSIVFTTGDELAEGSAGIGGNTSGTGSTLGGTGTSASNGLSSSSGVRNLPMRRAAEGTTALAGQALTLDGAPLANVRIEVGSQFAVTDNTGRFLVQNVGSGHHVMIIDGTTANSKSVSYGLFRVGVDLKAGRTNSLNYTIWMTALDAAHEVSIPSPTTSAMVITNPSVPGLELHIPAGTVIHDARGKVVTRVGITGIPVSQPPFPLKQGVKYPVYFTIQPGGATFENRVKAWPHSVANRGQGITIHYQNYLSANPGSRFAFWSYDPEQKGWYIYGHGRVSSNAKDIAPEEGTQLWTFDGAMVSLPDNAPTPYPKPDNPDGADPVDLQTGLFVYRKTDLVLTDVIPLVLSRAYRPNDSQSRAFGIGTSMSFDDFMIGDDNQTTEGYTYQDFVSEDGGRVHFTRTSPCLGPNGYCDFTNAVYEAASTPGSSYGATLQYVASGPYSNYVTSGDYWQYTTKRGTTLVFPDSDNSSNPRAAAIQLMQDRHGNTVTLTRDENFNLKQVSSPNSRWIQFTYDSQNRVTQARDNTGRTTSYTYNASGYLETATDANGGVTSYTYDTNGNMTSIKDPRGIPYIQNTFDGNGMVTQQAMADGAAYHFSYNLDGNGNVTQTSVTDPLGHVREVEFNEDGFMSRDTRAVGLPEQQTIGYNRQAGTGLLLAMTDPLSRSTTYSYDSVGNMTAVTRLAGTSNAITTRFGYDQRYYEVSEVSDPLGNTTSLTYDSSGNMLTMSDALRNTTSLSYNTEGQPVTAVDPLGNVTQFAYESGNLVKSTDPLGRTLSRFIDGAGRVVSVSDPLNNQGTIGYDQLDEIVTMTDPMGNQTAFTYDKNGNLLTMTDANGNKTTYTYDNMDRLVKRTDPLGAFDQYTYDLLGNVHRGTDRKGQATTYTYDGLSRVIEVQYDDGNTVNYTWDAGNRLVNIDDSASGTISRSYDSLNRLTGESTAQGSVSYAYDTDGRRQTMSVSGQSPVSYSFDATSKLRGLSQGGSQVSMGYDADGRRISLSLPNGIAASYNYDAASQLAAIVYQGKGLPQANIEYTYDQAGRRTSVSGSLANTQLPVAVSAASYNSNNQLTSWGSTQITYDANGNTLNDGMNSYVWDARNRLVSANSGGATFTYDPLGRRVGKTILSVNTNFLYDGVNPVQELNGSTVTANMLTGGVDEYFMRTDLNGTSVILRDVIGSTIMTTDSSAQPLAQVSYAPYGSLSITGNTDSSYTYTGRESDGLGLYYYRARYYNPATGRFISEDPSEFFGSGANLYGYSDDDPINHRDPFGLYSGPYGPPVYGSAPGPVPPPGCSFPDCFWFYGNYGGPDWTGGQWQPWEDLGDPFAPGLPPGFALPMDAQDGCYLDHDRCYAQSRVRIKRSGKCDPNQSHQDQSKCDIQLVRCLNSLPEGDPGNNPGTFFSSNLFWLLSIYKDLSSSGSAQPSSAGPYLSGCGSSGASCMDNH